LRACVRSIGCGVNRAVRVRWRVSAASVAAIKQADARQHSTHAP
jgi:hypothetical protein